MTGAIEGRPEASKCELKQVLLDFLFLSYITQKLSPFVIETTNNQQFYRRTWCLVPGTPQCTQARLILLSGECKTLDLF